MKKGKRLKNEEMMKKSCVGKKDKTSQKKWKKQKDNKIEEEKKYLLLQQCEWRTLQKEVYTITLLIWSKKREVAFFRESVAVITRLAIDLNKCCTSLFQLATWLLLHVSCFLWHIASSLVKTMFYCTHECMVHVGVTERDDNRLCFAYRLLPSQLTLYTHWFPCTCCTGEATDDHIPFADCAEYVLGNQVILSLHILLSLSLLLL